MSNLLTLAFLISARLKIRAWRVRNASRLTDAVVLYTSDNTQIIFVRFVVTGVEIYRAINYNISKLKLLRLFAVLTTWDKVLELLHIGVKSLLDRYFFLISSIRIAAPRTKNIIAPIKTKPRQIPTKPP